MLGQPDRGCRRSRHRRSGSSASDAPLAARRTATRRWSTPTSSMPVDRLDQRLGRPLAPTRRRRRRGSPPSTTASIGRARALPTHVVERRAGCRRDRWRPAGPDGVTEAGWGGRRGAGPRRRASWISSWSCAVSALTALRGTRPASVRCGGGIGSPTISTSLARAEELGALGHHRLAAADAHRDDRHVGLGRHVGGAVEELLRRPGRSGGCPRGTSRAGCRRSRCRCRPCRASRSALPRCTGKAPSIDTNRPSGFDFQMQSLPM